MRRETITRVAVVESGDAKSFEQELNAVLSDKDKPDIQLDRNKPYLAYIFYKEDREVAETLEDRFYERGLHFCCKDCIHFEKPQDRRLKRGMCVLKDTPTKPDSRACEMLYRMLIEGESVLVHKDLQLTTKETFIE